MRTMWSMAMGCVAILAIGCGSGTEVINDVDDVSAKADGVSLPVGTFRADANGASLGSIVALTLKTDNTFHMESIMACFSGPCKPFAEEGTFKYTKSGSKRYLRLESSTTISYRFFYEYNESSRTLTLKNAPARSGATNWINDATLTLDWETAWCNATADCDVQDLPKYRCIGVTLCKSNVCSFCETQQICSDVGGQCAIDTCDGEYPVVDNSYLCPTGLSVCCMPASNVKQTCDDAGGQCAIDYCDADNSIVDNTYSCPTGLSVCCMPKGSVDACMEACPTGCPAPEYQICGDNGQLYCNECVMDCYSVAQAADPSTCK